MTNMPFAKMLTEYRRGELEADLSRRLDAVLEALAEHGGKGEVSLKIRLQKTKHGALDVTATPSHRIPEPKMAPALFFQDADGNLVRNDPNQMDIEDQPGVRRSQGGLGRLSIAD